MSVELRPSHDCGASNEDITDFAKKVVTDTRISDAIDGFDVPFYQAGLAGYSDAAMRLIARSHGCPLCVTEALLDRTLISGGKGRRKEDPDTLAKEIDELQDGDNRELFDHPIAGQIIGTDPKEMASGALILVDMGYDVIDVNLACPVKKARRRNRGGHFLSAPHDACEILSSVRKVVPDNIPTTVKLRCGWDDSVESKDKFYLVFDHAYSVGYTWTTVHPRTVEQRYQGPSDWSFLSELTTNRPDALVFGSGDIWCAEDIFRMMKQTGVHGVSVARGCIGNPWIFKQARALMKGKKPQLPTINEQRLVLLEHLSLCTGLHGEKKSTRLMRKFGIQFSKYHPETDEVKKSFIQTESVLDWKKVIDRFYHRDSNC
ncbi:MAG: tRNA-dihydrouridine synthase family protein [Phycisphaerales bacterium]|nr:tRNA-dihydrouridine synthase family protein [Phycisphaerales bacterium]